VEWSKKFPSSQKDTFPFTRIAIYKEVPCISKLVLCEEKIEQVVHIMYLLVKVSSPIQTTRLKITLLITKENLFSIWKLTAELMQFYYRSNGYL